MSAQLDPKEQLRNIEKLRIMQYKYKQAFAEYSGLPECDRLNVETGVVAQELQEILPDAVYSTGDVQLPTGENIDNFLVVNKDRIYMESIGAVKELCRLNNKLETRINEIEKVNRKLAKLKRLDSLKSTSSGSLRWLFESIPTFLSDLYLNNLQGKYYIQNGRLFYLSEESNEVCSVIKS